MMGHASEEELAASGGVVRAADLARSEYVVVFGRLCHAGLFSQVARPLYQPPQYY